MVDEYVNLVKQGKSLHVAAKEMYELLKEIEAKSTRCLICGNRKENGHDYGCRLMQALSRVKKEEEE